MASRPKLTLSIKEKDLGLEHILAEAKKLAMKPYLKIGIQGDTALNRKKQRVFFEGNAVIQDADVTVVDVATFHEFGTETIPERSFIRSTMDANGKEFAAFSALLVSRIMSGSAGMTTERALGIMGERIQAAMQSRFTDDDNGWAPLKYRDGTPLIDTAQMIRSIRWARFMK